MHHLAIVGGTGMEEFMIEKSLDIKLTAIYNSNSKRIEKTIDAREINLNGNSVIFVNRHRAGKVSGKGYYRPHEVDYKTIMVALHQHGVKKIVSICAVGSLERNWRPGELVLIKDYIDLVNRDITLDDLGGDFADMTKPFDPELNKIIKVSAESAGHEIIGEATYVLGVDGSKFETPAEINLIRKMASESDKLVVGMTIPTEAQLAKLLGIKYASIGVITNYASGMTPYIKHSEIEGVFIKQTQTLCKILSNTINNLLHAHQI